jgi:hypothetical protein
MGNEGAIPKAYIKGTTFEIDGADLNILYSALVDIDWYISVALKNILSDTALKDASEDAFMAVKDIKHILTYKVK